MTESLESADPNLDVGHELDVLCYLALRLLAFCLADEDYQLLSGVFGSELMELALLESHCLRRIDYHHVG